MMPGSIPLEAITQLGGLVAQTDPKILVMSDLRLTALQAAKIYAAALPGELLRIRAKAEGCLGGLVQIEGPAGTLATARVPLSGSPAV